MIFGSQLMKWDQFRYYQQSVREEGRFPAYCQQLQNRLIKHDFRRPIQLNEDLHQQDKLATWVEFLNYEYSKYDKTADFVSRWQSQHDDAWKILVDSNFLKPSETEESLWGLRFGIQLENEEIEAQMAVESAASVVKSAEKLPKRALPRMKEKLSAARSRLAMAEMSLNKISKRRNLIVDFHRQTKSYKIAKTDANNQSILLRWILQQVPLIESELNPGVSSGKVSTGLTSQRRSKRKLIDDQNLIPVAKRQKVGKGATTTHSNIYASTDHETSAQQVRRPRTRASTLDDRRGVFEERFYNQLPRRSSRPKRPPERFQ